MEQAENKLPCIVQALRAAASPAQQSSIVMALGSNVKVQPSPSANPSRCTRSQAAPDWSGEDTLVLIDQVAAVDTEAWSRSLSSFQKWKIISGNCTQFGLNRSSNQCKRRWELLLSEYRKVRKWETRSKSINGSGLIPYWRLDPQGREKYGLPGSLDKEVYHAIHAVIKVEESSVVRSKDVDSELLVIGPIDQLDVSADVAVPNTDFDADFGGEKDESEKEPPLNPDKILAWDLAAKLQENLDRVQSTLGDEIGGESIEIISKYESMENTLARKKAEELIESFGVLAQNLDRFAELMKTNGFENIVSMN